jgi:hypothetical protein
VPTLDRAPSAAEVAASWYATQQAIPAHERAVHQASLEHAAVIERQQELQRTAPAVGVAWKLVKALKLAAVPLHPTTLEPVADPISDQLAVLDYWTANPNAACGIRLGVHRGGALGLVAVKATTWADWQSWVAEYAVDERVRPWDVESPGRGELVRDPRPLGGPSFIRWTGPPGPPIRSFSSKGDRELAESADRLRAMSVSEDRGGALLWSCRPVDGKLPALKHRPLSAGLVVLGDGDTLALSARTPQGWVLHHRGLIRDGDGVHDCPAWLVEAFGGRWVKV